MLRLLLVLSVSHTAAGLVEDQSYCTLRYRRLCQGKGRHVACQFPIPGPGASCENYTEIKFTSDLKHFILHYINKRRQRIAAGSERVRGGDYLPQPSIMMLVSWDRELANLAQRLADQCHFVHDDCRATVRYPYAGQSVGEVRWRVGLEGEAAGAARAQRRVLDAWWGERRRVFARQLVTPFKLTNKDMVWGHFSQLAVWTLRAIGCGAVRHGFKQTRMLLVCDFSHTNMLGQRTINPGPVAPCPIHTARRPRSAYPLLCAKVKKPTIPDKEDYNIKGYDDANEEDTADDEMETRIVQTKGSTRNRDGTAREFFRSEYSMNRAGRVENEDAGNTTFELPTRKSKAYEIISKKLDNQFEMSNNEDQTIKENHQWETSIPDLGRLREKQKSEDYSVKTKAKTKLVVYDDEEEAKLEYEEQHKSRSDAVSNQGSHSRHRWKQTRRRPQRPGANALRIKAPEKFLSRSSLTSFILDKDDSDQLFRDTGFNVNWRKQ